MWNCKKCGASTGKHRAEVEVCTKCGLVENYDELITLLKELKISPKTIRKVEEELSKGQASIVI